MSANQTPTFIEKYKPYYLKDFQLHDKTEAIIKLLIEINDMNLLLVGSQGTGKTALLNALIREYYGLTKTDSFPDTNILIINNLKEQGINYFRQDMKTFCQSHSSIFGKKKMIIIDDIDNINEQSQQVFRNYIDKYSHNIHFVSVCTNIQKVIESLQSRTHIIKISSPTLDKIRIITENIIVSENIDIDAESVEYILKFSKGNIRVLIHYLEKMYIYGNSITLEICKKMCSNICYQEFENYVQYIKVGDLNHAIEIFYKIYDYGYSVIDIFDYFFDFIKTTHLIDETTKYMIIPIICKYITIFHNIHEDVIELALFTNNIIDIFIPAKI